MEKIFDFILHPEFKGFLLFLKFASIVVSIFFLAWILFLLLRSSWLRFRATENLVEFITYRPFASRRLVKQWKKIAKLAKSNKEQDYKLAIIEADSVLEEALKGLGCVGQTTQDRLEKLDKFVLSNLDQVKEANNIRNQVTHNPDYKLSRQEAQRIFEIYEKALRELDML